jgi:hypothetical protein
MSLLRSLFGPSKDDVWSQLADQVGGRFTDGGFFGRDRLEVRVDPWVLTLDTYTVSNGKHHTTYTRLRAPFVNADGFRFTVYRAGLFSPLGTMLGMQDIEIGDPNFDQAFVLKGNDEDKVRRFFADNTLKALLYAQSDIHLEVKDDEGWFGQSFPEGVDELYFSRVGVMTSLPELHALFDLFGHTLHRLCHFGSAYENDPDIRL